MSHTPGPWIADDSAELCVTTEEGLVIADVACPEEHDWREDMANARLIAEAPNMLDALRQVLAWRGLDGDGISDPVRQHVIGVIAKATGEPS